MLKACHGCCNIITKGYVFSSPKIHSNSYITYVRHPLGNGTIPTILRRSRLISKTSTRWISASTSVNLLSPSNNSWACSQPRGMPFNLIGLSNQFFDPCVVVENISLKFFTASWWKKIHLSLISIRKRSKST